LILALQFPVPSNTGHQQQQHIIGKTKQKKKPKTKTLQLPFTKRAFQRASNREHPEFSKTVEDKKLFLLLQEVLFFLVFFFFLVVV